MLGKYPPAKVSTIRVRLKENCLSIRVKARRFSARQREILDAYLKKLVDLGFCEEMGTATWEAAPLLVPKKESRSNYRLLKNLFALNCLRLLQ